MRDAMVVEFLTFTVPVDEQDVWLEIEAQHWTRYLERQPGFVRKEMWTSADDRTRVHAVIWWASLEQWKAIPAEELAEVADAMGTHERHGVCDTFQVLRRS
jgi:uncharacterized protein (TIGR03792 family)